MADKETIILEIKYKDGKVVTKEIKEQTKALKDEEKQVDKVGESFGKLKVAGVAALAALMVLAKKSMDAFIKQEQAVVQVEASLRALGKYTPKLSKDYQDLASSLQRVGRWGDVELLPASEVHADHHGQCAGRSDGKGYEGGAGLCRCSGEYENGSGSFDQGGGRLYRNPLTIRDNN